MEVVIVEESKNKLIFDIKGETNTLTGALKKELWNDEHVKTSGYHIDHPLINVPRFIVETDGADPRKTVKSALKRLDKVAEKLKEQAKLLK
ncbi:DNA-directed RNA polymerase subunit L [Candidatus Woesearchaeota archaeon]|nr:DNA-directed RNA polymerase subunit L [Candidatus Woesearchaeota archaeon]